MVYIPPEVVAGAAKLAKDGVITILGAAIGKEIKKHQGKSHGSKVKMGAFQECSIKMFGNKACIVTGSDRGGIVLLTSENIVSYGFVKEKFRKTKLKTYYYYEITFTDGQKSYVRMSKKYRDAMLSHT